MRNTLIIGLLLCLPVAVLLASASLAGTLCRWVSRRPEPGPVLPHADRVAGRVTGHRHPQVTLGIRLGGHFAAGSRDPGQGLVDVLNVYVGDDPGFAGYRQVGHGVADDWAPGGLRGGAVPPALPGRTPGVVGRRTAGGRS